MMKRLLARTALVSLSVCSNSAWAQAAPASTQPGTPAKGAQSDPTSLNGPRVEDIVVTAQKRSENAQSVPIAITAISAEALSASGVTSPVGLTMLTPGLNFTKQVAYGSPYIRGVGIAFGTAGDEPPVATYIDGVYTPAFVANALNFNNIERVEVLKGPQGTLFGRNATGGLFNIITKTPSHTFGGSVELSYDNYRTLDTSLYLTGGISDSVAASLAVTIKNQGKGYDYNIQNQERIGKDDIASFRTKWLIDLSNAARVTLALDYINADLGNGTVRSVVQGTTPLAALGGGQFTTEPRRVYTPYTPVSHFEQVVGSVQADIDLGGISLRSISAYRHLEYTNEFNATGTSLQNVPPLSLNYYAAQRDPVTLTQEFQLSSGSKGNFEWLVGAFGMYGKAGYDPFYVGFSRGQQAQGATTQQITTALAAYGQATYRFDNGLSVTGGLRFNYEEKKFHGNGLGAIAAVSVDAEHSWSDPTWRLSVDYKIGERALVYASYNRGFKSGVYATTSLSSTPVNPEYLDAYEVGFKSQLFDRRLQLNGAAYYYNFKNLQVFSIVPGGAGAALANAAQARIYGMELEAKAVVTRNVSLNAGLSLSNPKYRQFQNAQVYVPDTVTGAGNATAFRDASGMQLERSPKTTFNLGADLSVPLSSGGKINGNVVFYHNSGFSWDPIGRIRQGAYETVNASLTWFPASDDFSIALFSNNLTNTLYSSTVTESNFGDTVAFAPPRTIGARVRKTF